MVSHTECNLKWIGELKDNLNTEAIGKVIKCYDIVDSTNDIARKLASEGAEEGTVVLAGMQRAGKGRLNREWLSPKGGLWFSVILRPYIKPSEAMRVTMIGGVAVARTLAKFGLDARIKWPNDVLINDKKVCGILTEMRSLGSKIDFLILGIGINANFDLEELPESIRDQTTTLREKLGKDLDVQELLSCLLEEIDKCYVLLKSGNSSRLLYMWRELNDTLGRDVEITTQKETIQGIALDVDGSGALIVRMKDGTMHKFLAGDVIHISRSI